MQFDKKLLERVEKNPFLKRYAELGIKENLFSDMAGALGRMHNRVVSCAYPELIGRKIITARLTKEPVEKFALDSKAVAYTYAEGSVRGLVERRMRLWQLARICWLSLRSSGRESLWKMPRGM